MVEIIPKGFRPPLFSPLFVLFLSIILFVSVLAALFLITQMQSQARGVLQSLEQRLSDEQIWEGKELQKQLETYRNKISDFRFVIEQRKDFLPFFQFFEETIHPNVAFTRFKATLEDNIISVSGVTTDFLSLEEQRLVWKARKEIGEVVFEDLVLGSAEGKAFTADLFFVEPLVAGSATSTGENPQAE